MNEENEAEGGGFQPRSPRDTEERSRIGRLLKLIKRYRAEHTAHAVGADMDENGCCHCVLCAEGKRELKKGGLHLPRRRRTQARSTQ